ncbi:hypothetical protein [Paenibacillus timonensis]|uniref:hypothetical protein n=1 Tax=Paenibacillus timonensis TaxID=225915 RepID=UPI003F9D1DA9
MLGNISLGPDLSEFAASIAYDFIGGTEPEVNGSEPEPGVYRFGLTFRLDRPVRQDDWRVKVVPAFAPSFHWAPHLTPTDRHVIDQHSFRSPALIVWDNRRMLALIPDLDVLGEGTQVRWYMDNDASRNELVLGMGESRVKEHVLYERMPGASYAAGNVKVGFYLMVSDAPEALANPWRPVLRFLWKRWGAPLYRTGAPLTAPLEPFVRHSYRWAFEHWERQVWQEFELNGTRVGAPAFIVNITQSPNFPGPASERETRSIWNQAWFSSLRSAAGVFRYGREQNDPDLIRRARLTKELALSAPQRGGFFPSVIATEMEQIQLGGALIRRSKGWETAYWGNSNRNPLPDRRIKEAPYHIADMSWTALWMLRWYGELERDPRLLAYAVRYGDALIAIQDALGFFPAWLDWHTLEPLEALRDSPETAVSVTFLLQLGEMTGQARYTQAALQAAKVIAEQVVPEGRWEDFETYWSCSGFGVKDHLGRKYARNNIYKQCNLSMFWAAEAFLGCFRRTGEPHYLAIGERCLDEMLMTQASWQPPYLHVDVLGGFGVMNADGEWNDSRQSLFAELILEYGRELGRTEYLERGLAALKASFVMMYCPENPKTKAQWEEAFPFFGERDYGFMMENYGHGGEVNEQGVGMGEFTIFDWGNGAAAESYLRIKAHHPELDI